MVICSVTDGTGSHWGFNLVMQIVCPEMVCFFSKVFSANCDHLLQLEMHQS